MTLKSLAELKENSVAMRLHIDSLYSYEYLRELVLKVLPFSEDPKVRDISWLDMQLAVVCIVAELKAREQGNVPQFIEDNHTLLSMLHDFVLVSMKLQGNL